jgi:elongator complex protein 2
VIVGYTLTGAFYVWRFNQGNWDEVPTVSGHYAEVTDLDFNEYVVSCSMD